MLQNGFLAKISAVLTRIQQIAYVLMMFKGLRLPRVLLSRFAQYPLDHSFCFLYFCFVLCIYFDVSNEVDKIK